MMWGTPPADSAPVLSAEEVEGIRELAAAFDKASTTGTHLDDLTLVRFLVSTISCSIAQYNTASNYIFLATLSEHGRQVCLPRSNSF